MLMHAALPGTQHLNDSKSASAPLQGMGHSTVLHQLPPFSLDIEHSTLVIRNETGTKQGQRIPTSCCILGFGKSLGNSRCGSRQNLFRCSLLPGAQPCLVLRCHHVSPGHCPAQGSVPAPTGTACPAGHWPSVAPAGLPGPRHRWQTRGRAEPSPILLALVTPWKEAKKTFP